MPTVTVIGSGAIGKFYGGLFTLSGCQVCYLERSDFLTIQKKQFYEIELPDGNVIQVKPHRIEKDFNLLPKSDLVIIALKTTENHLLPRLLPAALKPKSCILLLQNGIGNEEYLSTVIKTQPIVCGVTTTGVSRTKPAYIKIKHLGELKLAPFSRKDKSFCESIKQILTSANLPKTQCPPIQLFENHRVLRWSKLLWNTSFSTLSLLFNTSVDVLASQKEYQDIIRAIMQEICLVAKKEGAEIENIIEKLIELTATLKSFYPSMHSDFKMGRAIESQYIVFNVIVYAQAQDLKVPVLSLCHEKLKKLVNQTEWFSLKEQSDTISLCKNAMSAKEKKEDRDEEMLGFNPTPYSTYFSSKF